MTIIEEQAVINAEKAAEVRRRWTAASVSAACAIAAAFILLVMTRFPGHLSDTILRSLLAMLLATALVLGARALDGPVRFREQGRGQNTSSEAAAALMLWLGCFATMIAAFLVSDLVSHVDVVRTGVEPAKDASADGAPHVGVNRHPRVANGHLDQITVSHGADPDGGSDGGAQ